MPAFVINTGIIVRKLPGGLHRNMNSLESDIGEEWLFAVPVFVQIRNHLIDKKFRGIEVLRQGGRLTVFKPWGCRVIRHIGFLFPIVRSGCVQYEGSIETVIVGKFPFITAKMPFTCHQRPVSRPAQPVGERFHTRLKTHGIARRSFMRCGQHFRDCGDTGAMIINAREQHRSGWRAKR